MNNSPRCIVQSAYSIQRTIPIEDLSSEESTAESYVNIAEVKKKEKHRKKPKD